MYKRTMPSQNTHHITLFLIEIHGRHSQIQWKTKL